MRRAPKVLLIVPPIRLHAEEFDYLVHWPRHAVVIAAELGDEYDVRILDVTAEFSRDPAALIPDAADEPSPEPPLRGRSLGPVRRRGVLADRMCKLIEAAVGEFAPDVIGVHAHAAPHLPIVRLALDAIRRALPAQSACQIVLGGMAATHLAQVLADWVPDNSWIVRGEATGRARDLFALIRGDRPLNPATEQLETLAARDIADEDDGQHASDIVRLAPRSSSERARSVRLLDVVGNPPTMNYPLPRFDLLPMDVFQRLYRSGEFVPHLEFGSGCTYACRYCGVHYLGAKGRFRRRPVAHVAEEMKFLRSRFGFDEFYFCDETFTLDTKHARQLCQMMCEELPGIRWRCVTRVDCLDDEMLRLMRAAGCYEIGFGVEVGSEAILAGNEKEATVAANIATIRRVEEHGIIANALTIIGLPQEDHSDIRRTFEFLARDARPSRCQIFVFHPVPGTEYFLHPERFGLRFDTRHVDEWYKWDHIGQPVCETQYLSCEDIARYFMLFNRAFSTIVDAEPDRDLTARILAHRFPVRRKGVAWHLHGNSLRVFHGIDPSQNILSSSLAIEFAGDSPGGRDGWSVRSLEYVLSRCNGLVTEDELVEEVARLFSQSVESARLHVFDSLDLLRDNDFVTDF